MLQSGVDSLVLSIVPGDNGKPTTRLEKAIVHDGNCKWENPVYEAVKFNQDPKNGKFSEKVYYFVISTVCFLLVVDFLVVSCECDV